MSLDPNAAADNNKVDVAVVECFNAGRGSLLSFFLSQ